jgi:hypothetical protein
VLNGHYFQIEKIQMRILLLIICSSFIALKIMIQMILDFTRKDNKSTPDGGLGGGSYMFLLPIPNHDNRHLNRLILVLNYGFYLGVILITIIQSCY